MLSWFGICSAIARSTGSSASSSSCADTADDDAATPLIDLAHADSGRLRTATMDSDCPTGLQFAPAEGWAWAPQQPQSQHSWRPAQQQFPAVTRVQSAAAGGGQQTQRLSLRTDPERISEGGGFRAPDPGEHLTHPAAPSGAAIKPPDMHIAVLKLTFVQERLMATCRW